MPKGKMSEKRDLLLRDKLQRLTTSVVDSDCLTEEDRAALVDMIVQLSDDLAVQSRVSQLEREAVDLRLAVTALKKLAAVQAQTMAELKGMYYSILRSMRMPPERARRSREADGVDVPKVRTVG